MPECSSKPPAREYDHQNGEPAAYDLGIFAGLWRFSLGKSRKIPPTLAGSRRIMENNITRQLRLLLENDEPLYQKCVEIARINAPLSDDREDYKENIARDIEEMIRDRVDTNQCDPVHTLASAALEEVDWDEIADSFGDDWEDVDGMDDYDEDDETYEDDLPF